MKYKFWSIYGCPEWKVEDRRWFCIPPDKKYIPDWYPKGALVKKHEVATAYKNPTISTEIS